MELVLNGKSMRKVQAPHAPGAGWNNASSDDGYQVTYISAGDVVVLSVLNGEFRINRPEGGGEVKSVGWITGGGWEGWLGLYGANYVLWSHSGAEVLRSGSVDVSSNPDGFLTDATVSALNDSLVIGTSFGTLHVVPYNSSAQSFMTQGMPKSSEDGDQAPILCCTTGSGTAGGTPWIAAGDGDGQVGIWDLPLTAESRPRVVFPGLRMIASSSSTATLSGQNHPGTTVVPVRVASSTSASPVTSMASVGDGAYIAVGYTTGQLLILDVATGQLWAEIAAHARAVTAITALPGPSPMLASAGEDGVIQLWSIPKNSASGSISHRGSTTVTDSIPVGLVWVGVESACADQPPSLVVLCYDRSTVFVLPTGNWKA